LLLVGGGELEVHGAGGAPLQQLDLDLADAAADFEYRRTLDPAQLEKLDHLPRRLIESSLSIARRHAARKTRREKPVTSARIAAARHGERAYARGRLDEVEGPAVGASPPPRQPLT